MNFWGCDVINKHTGCPKQPSIYFMIISNLKFEAYCGVFYAVWVDNSLKTLNQHHCFPLVIIGCPWQSIMLIIKTLKSEAYFEMVYPFVCG